MKVFEVSFAGAKEGTIVTLHKNLPAIVIGEDGRGRELGVLYVKGVPPKERVTEGKLVFINHLPVLVANEHDNEHDNEDKVLVVARIQSGFRGHGYLRGRYVGWRLQYDYIGSEMSEEIYPTEEAAEDARMEQRKKGIYVKKTVPVFEDGYEPHIIAKGIVADGMAGNMASAEQFIFIAREGDQFSLHRTGRLYGGEPVIQFKVVDGRVVKYDESLSLLEEFLKG